MADYTDLELAKMEQAIHHTYTAAQKEIQKKWDKYMAKAQPKVDKAQATYAQAMLHGTAEEMAKAKEAYEKAALNMTLQNEHYQAMVNQVTNKLAETNQIALTYLNDQMPKVYCHSYNEFGEEKIKGYSFEMVNEETVKNLIKDGNKSLLPQKQLNIPKDKQWNTKNINSQVLQGILQGENSYKISKRLTNVTDMNYKSALRNARTMTTGAYNKGRQDSFERATNDGVKMKRRWVVAHDARLRDWHADLDGVEVDIDEAWTNDYGEIMYPGDPTAHPANIYNCRCSIRAVIKGFKPVKKTISDYAEQYQGTGVTAQYYSMLDENKALGNEFWKLLKAEGKPGQVWKDYLAGNTSKELTSKIDDVLAKYKGTGKAIKPGTAKKAAAVVEPPKPKPDLGMYQDKSMTATYYSVKAESKDLGKEFWAAIQAEENPSAAWNQYLIGTAPKELTDKLDNILLQHKGEGAWTKPISAKKAANNLIFKPEFDINDVYKLPSSEWIDIVDIYSKKYEGNGYENLFDLWQDYKAGKIADPDLDKIFKMKAPKTTVKSASKMAAKAIEESDDLLKAKEQLAIAQGNLDSLGNPKFSGIWKEPVTLADYEAKAISIQSKKSWYYDQIEDLTHKVDAGDIAESVANAKIKQYEKYIDDLIEFESQGKLYAQYEKEYKLAAKKVKDLTPVGDTFGPDAYTQFRKNNAVWAKSGQQADDVLREASGEVWRNAKSTEKHAIYEYTQSYHKYNEPLRGIEYGSNAYKGVGKTDLNAGYASNGKRLNAMTDILEKSALPQDQWFQRGCSYSGMDKFFACGDDLLRYGTQEELEQALLGKTVTEYGFMSMGSAKGQGFSGDILMNIYAPEGTKAMYVEPFSAFGNGSGKSWDGVSKQYSFGHELETILQQNTDFRIAKIERKGGTLYFDLEIIAQNKPQRWIP